MAADPNDDLEARLAALAVGIEWPATPELQPAVMRRAAVPGPWLQPLRSRWALAAVAVLVIAATLLAYTPARTAIAGWLNLHTTINRTTALPTPSPLPSGTLGSNLGLGTPTTVAGAQNAVGWQVLVPAQLGTPDAVYVQLPPEGPLQGEVSLVYAPRPGIANAGQTGVGVLVTEARGSVNEQFFAKTIGPGTTITDVSVNGHDGWWISGQPHAFVFIDANNDPRIDTLRLATNTLVVDEEGTIVRIEAGVNESTAVQIAGSIG